jgi:hypothetical protein
MILDDAEVCTSSSSLKVTSEPSTFLGEKSQRRRRASFVGAKDGWDAMLGGAGEESYFAAAGATASTAVYGH